ncbi:unnamed protein product [Dovyalis caffra]|uniref:Dirigent protein n=1 Tax=Dovyalis caffra TaxID=77055 RepID=A0AAV1QYG3_9ROSI|nr:unnamed protein product [Dovyalis caffra]
MASFLVHILLLLYVTVILAFSGTTNGKFSEQSPMIISAKRMEKMTRLHFYFHDIPSGKNPTTVRIAGPAKTKAGGFGRTFMADNPLTEEPEPTSKLVGRAQGTYAVASQHETGLLMVFDFAFVEGMYNGSALIILGRNQVFDESGKCLLLEVAGFSGSLEAIHC